MMDEVERIARKVLTKELAKKVEELPDNKQKDLLPDLQKLEDFLDACLKE